MGPRNYKYLRDCPMEDGSDLFRVTLEDRSKAKGFKKQRIFQLTVTEN